jgi:hypothetical protein
MRNVSEKSSRENTYILWAASFFGVAEISSFW